MLTLQTQPTHKYLLPETALPTHYYNILADMPHKPQPPLHPGTHEPLSPQDLSPLFPQALIEQEQAEDRYVLIPEPLRDLYATYRPTPLYRAHRLERALDTPARIYYKYEGVSPSGSHKPNTAFAQAYYSAQEGVKRITTETGAGQWGTALAIACKQFGLECEVYMVGLSYHQKPYRKTMMNAYGAEVYASPSGRTAAGRRYREEDENHPGSLGIAISEAIEQAQNDPDTKYALGSVLNHVLMHQTIIGQETLKQLEMAEAEADVVIAPFGGGSNFAGLAFPFLEQNLRKGKQYRCVAVEPASCPKLTRGKFAYDFGDTAGLTPLMPMYTLGHNFVPAKIHAGGLRYHGAGVLVSQLLKDGLIAAEAVPQLETFRAGLQFARTEGILPAPEANHAVAYAIREANEAKAAGQQRTIVFNLCGHGHFDLSAYEDYMAGKLQAHALSTAEIDENLKALPQT